MKFGVIETKQRPTCNAAAVQGNQNPCCSTFYVHRIKQRFFLTWCQALIQKLRTLPQRCVEMFFSLVDGNLMVSGLPMRLLHWIALGVVEPRQLFKHV